MLVKCQRCEVKDTDRKEMLFEIVGEKNKIKKYYHEHCFQEHLKDKEFKKHEAGELDKLVEVIKQIYGIKTVPNPVYPYLQDLRNGTKFFGKNDYKYKQGYEYSLIAETFDYCSETIEDSLRRIPFNGTTNAIKYGLSIVCDKMKVVETRKAKQIEQEIVMKKQLENIDVEEQKFETNYKKPSKRNNDITDFLDD